MALYDKALVDESTKGKLLEILAQYDSSYIWRFLPYLSSKLLNNRSEEGKKYYSVLDQLAEWRGDDREYSRGFWTILYNEAEFKNDYLRIATEKEKKDVEELAKILVLEMENFSYSAKINTWLAVCEKYIQICNIDDVVKNYKKSKLDLPPPLELTKRMIEATLDDLW